MYLVQLCIWPNNCKFYDSRGDIQANGAAVLGTVVGGSSLEQRRRCACEVAKRNVAGLLCSVYGTPKCLAGLFRSCMRSLVLIAFA